MKEVISIIIPVYNVQKHLDRCLKSIANQTYRDLEIILINDGSTDKSPEICDNWAMYDKRIKVIHKENTGPGDSRNVGINNATGDYLSFIDSDDFISIYYFEYLLKLIKMGDYDISTCEFNRTSKYINIFEYKPNYNQYKVITGKDVLEGKDDIQVAPWGKLYKRELFNELRFIKSDMHEDVNLKYKLMYLTSNIISGMEKLYYYFENNNSLMRSKFSLKNLCIFDVLIDNYNYFKEKNEEAYEAIILMAYLNTCLEYYKDIKTKYKDYDYLICGILNDYNKIYKLLMNKYNISFKDKLKFRIYKIYPSIFIYIHKIKNYKVN